MPTTDNVVLVTGATGRQGGAVARHLLERGWTPRALTRDPNSRAAKALAEEGAQVVAGDLDDSGSVERAMHGVYGVYSVQDYWTIGAKREVAQGKRVADVARQVNVQHLVYGSVGGADRASGIVHWETKWEVEQHIRRLALPATILRPAAFMDNYYIDRLELGILKGTLTDPIRATKTYQTIASDDIGAFAAWAFDHPKESIGLEIELAGSELTNPQAARVFADVLRRPVRFRHVPMPIVRMIGGEFYQMFRWFNASGFQADIPALKRTYPEVAWQSLETWLRREGWDKRARVVRPPPRD